MKVTRRTDALQFKAADKRLLPPLGYLLLTVLFTWPLLPNFLRAIPRGLPDSYQNIWNLWWMRTALFERHINPYYTGSLFAPYRGSQEPLPLYFHTLQPAISLPGGLISYLTGYTAAYNLLIVAGFVGTGWAAYLLASYFLKQWQSKGQAAAFLAGTFYAFGPYHQHSLALGQTSVFWQQWIPLYILALHRSLAELPAGRWKYFYPALAVVSLALCFYTDWYYFSYLVVYTAVLYLFKLSRALRHHSEPVPEAEPEPGPGPGPGTLTIRVAAIGGLASLSAAPVLWGTLRSAGDAAIQYVDTTVNRDEVNILLSSALSEWFGPLRQQPWGALYLGLVVLFLAGLGLLWRRGSVMGRGWLWWWAAVTAAALILSLGPYFRLSSASDSAQLTRSGLPMPYQLWQKIPFLEYGRSPFRFLAIATLGLSLLAGAGVARLLAALQARPTLPRVLKAALPVIILGVFIAEVWTGPLALDTLYYPAVLNQLAADTAEFNILEMPVTTHYTRDSRRMYFQAIQHHPMTSGYISRRTVQYFDEADGFGRFAALVPEPIFNPNSVPSQLQVLQLYSRIYNFRYLLNYRDEYTGLIFKGDAQQYERYLETNLGAGNRIFDDGRVSAYRIPPGEAGEQILAVGTQGGYTAEKLPDGRVYRWSKEQFSISLLSNVEREIRLQFTAWSLPENNQLLISDAGSPGQTIALEQSPAEYTIRVQLKPGRNDIKIQSTKPAVEPGSLGLPGQDDRRLAFAIGDVQIKQ